MRIRRCDCRVIALACALWAVSGRASAQAAPTQPPLHVKLDYQVDPSLGCPNADELSQTVSGQLGYDPFGGDTTATRHRVKASIVRSGAGTEAHVEWLNEAGESEGERRLSSESAECAEVARGLAFAIAVQIQLRASAEAPPPARPLQPAPAPKPPPPPPPPREDRALVMVGAGVLVEHGITPELSPGLRVFGSLSNQRVGLEVSTQASLPARRTLSDGTGFTVRELGAKLAPCLRYSLFGFCAVGMVGQLHVRGEGVDRVQSPSSLIAGGGARLQLVWPALPAFGALLQAEALVLLTPRTVTLNRVDVWSTAPVVLGASLDLAAIFR